MSPAPLCTVGQFMQRTPQRLFNDDNNLQFSDLTTNQVVGGSNLSGRAIFSKKVNHLAMNGFLFAQCF